ITSCCGYIHESFCVSTCQHSFPTRRSSDLSSRWVAKEWRSVCAETGLSMPAARRALRIARETTASSRWWRRTTPSRGSLERRRRSEEHTSELQSREKLVCRLLLAKKKITVV